ncbi:MAG: hypothetical protein ACPLPT_10800, partial [Moorellales bacterium]
VDDGSQDRTADQAAAAGARVIRLYRWDNECRPLLPWCLPVVSCCEWLNRLLRLKPNYDQALREAHAPRRPGGHEEASPVVKLAAR